jgi:hypothetical protein
MDRRDHVLVLAEINAAERALVDELDAGVAAELGVSLAAYRH